jgi:hypothetical protein
MGGGWSWYHLCARFGSSSEEGTALTAAVKRQSVSQHTTLVDQALVLRGDVTRL